MRVLLVANGWQFKELGGSPSDIVASDVPAEFIFENALRGKEKSERVVLMPSVLRTEDLALWDQQRWERTLHMVEEFSSKYVHDQDSGIEISEWKL